MALYKAVTTRKGHAASVKRQSRQLLRRRSAAYRRNRSVRSYRHLARTGSAFPRLPRRFAPRNDDLGECRGAPAPLHGLIPLYKALATRKGHAASVRRQSRQRLRRERRYSQIWQRVRSAMACTGRATASPRLPRRFAPRNDNLGECRGAPAPLHGLIPLYKALTARKGHAASRKAAKPATAAQ